MRNINTESEITYNSILLNNSKNKWSRLNKLLNYDTCKLDNCNLSKIINPLSNIDNYINQIQIPSSHLCNLGK